MIYLLLPFALAALVYQLLALAASIRQIRAVDPEPLDFPPVSILKPVRGLDPHFYDAIRSHALLDYPEFEILFGVADPSDLAIPEIERLEREFPLVPIRLIPSFQQAPNGKVGVLMDLAAEARHPLLLVNDSDIEVTPDYLKRVVAPLEDPRTGMVTCLYRGESDSLPGWWEALGIATDFAPSVLVARLVGVREFGLGSTLVFRAENLELAGGFEALADFIADDYQLAKHITGLGMRAVISRLVVSTAINDSTWAGVWRHQIRWARTIRVSRGGGYLGLPVTHTGLWALVAGLSGEWGVAAALVLVRIAGAWVAGSALLRSRQAAWGFLLAPLWDLWAFCIWAGGLFGNTAWWRGGRLKLSKDGRIVG